MALIVAVKLVGLRAIIAMTLRLRVVGMNGLGVRKVVTVISTMLLVLWKLVVFTVGIHGTHKSRLVGS